MADQSAATEDGLREILAVREEARDALGAYAEALRFWNAPDDEHTRHQVWSPETPVEAWDDTITAGQVRERMRAARRRLAEGELIA